MPNPQVNLRLDHPDVQLLDEMAKGLGLSRSDTVLFALHQLRQADRSSAATASQSPFASASVAKPCSGSNSTTASTPLARWTVSVTAICTFRRSPRGLATRTSSKCGSETQQRRMSESSSACYRRGRAFHWSSRSPNSAPRCDREPSHGTSQANDLLPLLAAVEWFHVCSPSDSRW
jgi:hypothetical protein